MASLKNLVLRGVSHCRVFKIWLIYIWVSSFGVVHGSSAVGSCPLFMIGKMTPKMQKRPIESEATKPTTLLTYVSKCVCVVSFSSFCKDWESATTSQILCESFAKQDWAKQQILFLLCKSGLQKAEPKTSPLSITVVDRICYRYAILPSYQTLFYISCMIKKQK